MLDRKHIMWYIYRNSLGNNGVARGYPFVTLFYINGRLTARRNFRKKEIKYDVSGNIQTALFQIS